MSALQHSARQHMTASQSAGMGYASWLARSWAPGRPVVSQMRICLQTQPLRVHYYQVCSGSSAHQLRNSSGCVLRSVQGSMPESEPTQEGVPGTRQLLAVVHHHCEAERQRQVLRCTGVLRAPQCPALLPPHCPFQGSSATASAPAAPHLTLSTQTSSLLPLHPPAARSACRTRQGAGGTARCIAPRPARPACPS